MVFCPSPSESLSSHQPTSQNIAIWGSSKLKWYWGAQLKIHCAEFKFHSGHQQVVLCSALWVKIKICLSTLQFKPPNIIFTLFAILNTNLWTSLPITVKQITLFSKRRKNTKKLLITDYNNIIDISLLLCKLLLVRHP